VNNKVEADGLEVSFEVLLILSITRGLKIRVHPSPGNSYASLLSIVDILTPLFDMILSHPYSTQREY
jgi:hypothetical protein